MKSNGFEYFAGAVALDPIQHSPEPSIGVWTRDLAETFGLGVAHFPQEESNPANGEYVEALSPDEYHLWVEQMQACRWEAGREVSGSYRNEIHPVEHLFADLRSEFDADPRTIDLEARWSNCMKTRGYQDASTFALLVHHYRKVFDNFRVRTFGGFDLDVDEKEDLQALIDDEIEAGFDAASCAEPLADQYHRIWAEYEERFWEHSPSVPQLPVGE